MADGNTPFSVPFAPVGGAPSKADDVPIGRIRDVVGRFGESVRGIWGRKPVPEPDLESVLETHYTASACLEFIASVNEDEARAAGQADGARAFPPPHSQNPHDAPYGSLLIGQAMTAAMIGRDHYKRTLGVAVREIQRPMRDLMVTIRKYLNHACDRIAAIETAASPAIVAKYKRAQAERRRLLDWVEKQGHWLDRSEPDCSDIVRTAAFVLMCLAIETLGNAATLEDSFPDGLRGAIPASLGIAALNVGFGLGVGAWFGRLRHHAKPYVRRVGWTGTFVCLALAFLMLFALAGVRHEATVLKQTFDEALASAGAWTIRHPDFLVVDIKSAALLAVGLAILLWSYVEGTKAFADPYFGFTSRARRCQAYQERADEAFEDFVDEVDAAGDLGRRNLEAVHAEAQSHGEAKRKALTQYERVGQMAGAEQAMVVAGVHRGLRAYAERNAVHRLETPAPVWFGRTLNLNIEWPNAEPDAFDAAVAAAHAEVERIQTEVGRALADLDDARKASLGRVNAARALALGEPAAAPHEPLPSPTESQFRRGS